MFDNLSPPPFWEWIAGIAIAAAGVVGGWFTRSRKKKATLAEKVDALTKENKVIAVELGQFRALISAATGEQLAAVSLEMLRSKLAGDASSLAELRAFILTMPRLCWFKRRVGPENFVMVQVSRVYADLYLGKPPSFYEGKADSEIWPPEVVKAFGKNDEDAWNTGRATEINEPVSSPFTGVHGHFKGVKWAFRVGGDDYVAGIGIHIPDVKETPNNDPN